MPREAVEREAEQALDGSAPLLEDPTSLGLELIATLPYENGHGLFAAWKDIKTGALFYGHDVREDGRRPFTGRTRALLLDGHVETIAVNARAASGSQEDLRAFRARLLAAAAGLPATLDGVVAAAYDATVAEFRLAIAVGEARIDGHAWNEVVKAMPDYIGRAFREHERDDREALAVAHVADAEDGARKWRAQTVEHETAKRRSQR